MFRPSRRGRRFVNGSIWQARTRPRAFNGEMPHHPLPSRLERQQAPGSTVGPLGGYLVHRSLGSVGSIFRVPELPGPCLALLPKLVQFVFGEVLDADVRVLSRACPDQLVKLGLEGGSVAVLSV